jgi:hypothetical protein
VTCADCARQGGRAQASRDGFTACPRRACATGARNRRVDLAPVPARRSTGYPDSTRYRAHPCALLAGTRLRSTRRSCGMVSGPC